MAQMNRRARPEPPLLRMEPFKGLNLSVTPTQLDDRETPDMLNMHIDERGALNKRTGYKRIIAHSLGDGPINGMFHFKKSNGTADFLFAHGTKLYKTSVVPDRNNRNLATWQEDNLEVAWESEVY